MAVLEYLECGHCGGPAVYAAADGLFYDDPATCVTCGIAGRVSVDEMDDELVAAFFTGDGRCSEPDCTECGAP